MAEAERGDGPLVLVTGGAGFIGSHTVDRLVEAGCRVVVLDDLSTGRQDNLARWAGDARVEVVEADVANGLFAPLAEVTRRRGPIARIAHFAAQTAVVQSIQSPFEDIRANYVGTAHVLEYARCCAVEKLVFASSSAVYADDAALPTGEDGKLRPQSPYGIDKLGGEHFLDYYADVHGVRSTAFRFFNVYGPRQDPSSPYSGVISIFAAQAIAGTPLTIYGDGEQTRDFIHVGDVARVVVDACLGDAGDGAVINLGTGVETSINDLARVILQQAESGSEVRYADARPGDIACSVAAIERAEELLGFRPTVSLDQGLRETLDWMRAASPAG